MEISLRQSKHKPKFIEAFYIASSKPDDWLVVLKHNNIHVKDIVGYLVPTSLSDVKTSGVFMVLKQPIKIEHAIIQYPYYKIGKNVYLPFKKELYPPLTKEELNNSFKYFMQCFHPSIGLIGWEVEDVFNWDNINFEIKKETTNWSLATYTPITYPKIVSISLIAPEKEEDVLEELENEVEKKDLATIPLEDEDVPSTKNKLLLKMGKPFLKVGVGITALLIKGLSSSNGLPKNTGTQGTTGNQSIASSGLHQLHNWLKNNLDQLEKEQQKELNKLLKMFDSNLSEAIKYAIPLGGDELGRGSSVPSFKLSKRIPSFNLGNMGTGVSTYGWNVDNHYYELRQKYIAAAQKECENKEYRKAAYIYAYLLKDYHNAANVLEEGGYFEEAAVLYLDKIKNKEKAALCYEKGMLYEKAIELYKDSNKNEKIGDLYTLLNKKEVAKDYFKIAIETSVKKGDYLNTARIEKEKLGDIGASKDTLLKGWKKSYTPEVCLKKYLEISFEINANTMLQVVNNVYAKHTEKRLRGRFLNVLANSPLLKYKVKELGERIAYEIISEQLTNGNKLDIHKLKNFVDDTFLSTDINRFIGSTPRKKQTNTLQQIKLDSSINWIDGIQHKEAMIFTGHNNTHWFIVRVNKYGNKEYYTLETKYQENTIKLVNNHYYSDEVLIFFYGENKAASEKIEMPKNKYFDRKLTVSHYYEFQEHYSCYAMSSENYYKIDSNEKGYSIYKYNTNRKMLENIALKSNEEIQLNNVRSLKYFEGFLYAINESSLYAIKEETGKVFVIDFETGIKDFRLLNANNILIKTYSGLIVYTFNQHEFICKIPFFSNDFFGKDALFINSNLIATYSENKLKLFSLENSETHLINEYTIEGIVKCLPINRNEFVVLTKDKTVCLQTI